MKISTDTKFELGQCVYEIPLERNVYDINKYIRAVVKEIDVCKTEDNEYITYGVMYDDNKFQVCRKESNLISEEEYNKIKDRLISIQRFEILKCQYDNSKEKTDGVTFRSYAMSNWEDVDFNYFK